MRVHFRAGTRYSTFMTVKPRHRVRRLHALAAFIAIFAAIFRAVVAPGWMPDPAAASDGVFNLVICTPAGPIEVKKSPGETSPSDGSAVLDLCPYAALAQLATLTGLQTVIHAPFEPAVHPFEAAAIFIAAFKRRWHARAPPLA